MTDGPSPVMADRLGGGHPWPHLYLWTMPASAPGAETLPHTLLLVIAAR